MTRGVLAVALLLAGGWVPAGAQAAGPAARADTELDAVLRLLAARRHGEMSFIEQHFMALLKRPAESSGELRYDAPNRLEKRTLEPRAETLLLVDDRLTVMRGHRSQVVDLKSYPQALPYVESIRATLAGDRSALQKTFKIDFAGGVARWTLILVPLDASLAKSVSQVQIDGAEDVLYKVDIREADGDRSLLTLRTHPAP